LRNILLLLWYDDVLFKPPENIVGGESVELAEETGGESIKSVLAALLADDEDEDDEEEDEESFFGELEVRPELEEDEDDEGSSAHPNWR